MYSKTDDARSVLKEKTADLHERLHRFELFDKFLNRTLGIGGYTRLMLGFRTFYRDLDAEAGRFCSVYGQKLNGYVYQPRLPMFDADLASLGIADFGFDRQSPHSNCPRIGNAGELAGAIYVIDGSVLGGMALNKAASSLLPGEGYNGRSYWDWCIRSGMNQWKLALTFINECWEIPQNRRLMIGSACQTFAAVYDALELHHRDLSAGPE